MNLTVCTIVVIYNGMRRNWIRKCFDSLQQSTILTHIIAVDNGSTDGSIEFIKENYHTVKLIKSNVNLGFGGANNIGIKQALELEVEYIFLLNQDAWIEQDTLKALIIQLQKNKKLGLISPLHLNGRGDALDLNFSLNINPIDTPGLYSDLAINFHSDKTYKANFICAAAWLITRKCFEDVGGFNPTFFHYGEDNNYCHRVIFKGLEIGMYPKAKIYHDRQDRKNEDTNGQKFLEKITKILIRLSNPNKESTVSIEIRKINVKILKSIILLRKSQVYELCSLKKVLMTKKHQIEGNLEISISGKRYAFL